MKRIFIENEHFDQGMIDTIVRHEYCLSTPEEKANFPKQSNDFFYQMIEGAMYNVADVFEAIKECDAIYASTSLVPMMGVMGSGMLFNSLMYKAIQENIAGKKLYIFNKESSVWWDELKHDLLVKCFANNELYALDEDFNEWIKMDVSILGERADD